MWPLQMHMPKTKLKEFQDRRVEGYKMSGDESNVDSLG